MTPPGLLSRAASFVPRSGRRIPVWVRLAVVPLVVLVVAAGVWVTGAVLTQDATFAMALTGAWFAVAGLAAVVLALRWRALALPVLAAYAVSATAIGGYLLVTSTVDRVVDEDVLVADPAPGAGGMRAGSGPMAAGEPTGPSVVAVGDFRSQAHETRGTATVLETADGRRVVTLTGFATEPGPDLRVYLVPDADGGVDDAVDVGGLKGNKGDQQYDVPASAPTGAVVIWCRAFSVAFGTAGLEAASG